MSGPWEAYQRGPWESYKAQPNLEESAREILKEMPWLQRQAVGAGGAMVGLLEGVKQLVGQSDQEAVKLARIARDEAPVGSVAADIAMTAFPFGLVGPSIRGAAAVGGGYGALQSVEADAAADAIKGKLINAGIGAGASAGGQAFANKVLGGVTRRVSDIERKVQEKAAQVAASETASARSAAGNAAQNAYRQLEHLRELGANRALTADERLTVSSLERELAEKALDKLMPAATMKQSTADAYREAMSTEVDRASKYAADKLSSNEVKQQVMARLKRYGPAAAGGVIGNMIFPGLSGAVGGAATGLVLRPAIRSMVNLSKNPAVQHGLLSPVQSSWVLNKPALPIASLLAAEGLLGQ